MSDEIPEKEHAGDCCLCRQDMSKAIAELQARMALEREAGVLQGRREACEVWNDAGFATIAVDTLSRLRARDVEKAAEKQRRS